MWEIPDHTYTHMFTFKQMHTAQEIQMAADYWTISHMHAWAHTHYTLLTRPDKNVKLMDEHTFVWSCIGV